MSKAILFLNWENIRRIRIPAVIFLSLAILVTASVLVAARLKSRNGAGTVRHENVRVTPSPRRVQTVRFTLYDAGIYPYEVRANPGRVIVSLEDLTGSSSGVIVERLGENDRLPAGAVTKATNRLRSRAELNLTTGRYEVVDANRRENRALLIVEDDDR